METHDRKTELTRIGADLAREWVGRMLRPAALAGPSMMGVDDALPGYRSWMLALGRMQADWLDMVGARAELLDDGMPWHWLEMGNGAEVRGDSGGQMEKRTASEFNMMSPISPNQPAKSFDNRTPSNVQREKIGGMEHLSIPADYAEIWKELQALNQKGTGFSVDERSQNSAKRGPFISKSSASASSFVQTGPKEKKMNSDWVAEGAEKGEKRAIAGFEAANRASENIELGRSKGQDGTFDETETPSPKDIVFGKLDDFAAFVQQPFSVDALNQQETGEFVGQEDEKRVSEQRTVSQQEVASQSMEMKGRSGNETERQAVWNSGEVPAGKSVKGPESAGETFGEEGKAFLQGRFVEERKWKGELGEHHVGDREMKGNNWGRNSDRTIAEASREKEQDRVSHVEEGHVEENETRTAQLGANFSAMPSTPPALPGWEALNSQWAEIAHGLPKQPRQMHAARTPTHLPAADAPQPPAADAPQPPAIPPPSPPQMHRNPPTSPQLPIE
ncbi:MAG: hypothetical protein AAF570_19270 [Bacteroidota bacterium]